MLLRTFAVSFAQQPQAPANAQQGPLTVQRPRMPEDSTTG